MSLAVGDCRVTLARWAAEGVRVQCVVTSPPYWGLRDYGTAPLVWGGDAVCLHEWASETVSSDLRTQGARSESFHGGNGHTQAWQSERAFCLRCSAWRGSLGLEPAPELYVAHLVEIFRLVRDVLADDGTLWLNLGDSYNSAPSNSQNGALHGGPPAYTKTAERTKRDAPGLKPKDLVGIPWRVAFALQADGWWLRSDIIWAKPNPMPESVTDRPTKAHEYLFLLTKRERYYYDAEAIKEPTSPLSDFGGPGPASRMPSAIGDDVNDHRIHARLGNGSVGNPAGRNRRSVWTIATTPFPGAHFACMPEDLVKPCILAGTSARGCCPKCGRQWERVVDRTAVVDPGRSEDAKRYDNGDRNDNRRRLGQAYQDQLAAHPPVTTGWEPGCACGLEPVPAVVLDPFMGSGTVAQVAQDLGRRWLGCELNEAYAAMGEKRTRQQGLVL